jgi:hypothetical protein
MKGIKMKNFLLLTIIFVSGCTTSSEYTITKNLEPSEGLVLANVDCSKSYNLGIYKSGYDMTKKTLLNKTVFDTEAVFNCLRDDSHLKVVSLEEGDYFIGSVSRHKMNQGKANSFTIEKGKINYIGDIDINTDTEPHKSYKSIRYPLADIIIDVSIVDRFDTTKKEFQERMPELAGKYPLVKNMAGRSKR